MLFRSRVKLEHSDLIRIGRNTLKFDASCEAVMLEALILSADEAAAATSSEQSRTWQFSRRLRLLGIDA